MSLTTPALVVLLLPYALTRRACTLFKSSNEFDVRVALHWASSPVPIVPACIPFRRSRQLQVPFVVLRNAEDPDAKRRVFTDTVARPKYYCQNTHPLHFLAHSRTPTPTPNGPTIMTVSLSQNSAHTDTKLSALHVRCPLHHPIHLR